FAMRLKRVRLNARSKWIVTSNYSAERAPWLDAHPRLLTRYLFVFVAEMRADDPSLQIFQRAQVFDDIAAGVIEKKLTVLGAADRDNPFEVIAVFEQIVDSLGNATARDDRDFGTR